MDGGADGAARKRARVAPDYINIVSQGAHGRTSETHYLTERCDCMHGVRVPDDVRMRLVLQCQPI